MRSKIGTQSRLAAHILALFLLIIMLVYVAPPAAIVAARSAAANLAEDAALSLSPGEPAAEGAATELPSSPAPAPGAEPGELAMISRERVDGDFGTISAPAPTPLQPSTLPLRPPESAAPDVAAEPATPADAGEGPVGDAPDAGTREPAEPVEQAEPTPPESVVDAATAVPAETMATPPSGAGDGEAPPETPADEASGGEGDVPAVAEAANSDDAAEPAEPAATGDPASPDEEPPADAVIPPAPQPDESGALVVVPSVNGSASQPEPLANLEVLGDGVYWLGPRHDLEKELAAIPEMATLVLLAPVPGYRVEGFDHVRTEVIPADAMDLGGEAAEHFLYLTSSGSAPVVAAAIPGARGAGFFKGAYLLEVRGMPIGDVLREIAPELEEAGTAGDEIEHRLRRLKD